MLRWLREDRSYIPTLLRDVGRVLNIVLPTALGNFAEYFPVVTGIAIVGHLSADDADELDALSLARAFFNIVAMAPGFGYISALRTLCPQAVGAGQPKQCAAYLQRAFVLLTLGAIPAATLLVYAEPLLVLCGQPPHLAALAQPYAVRLIPSYFGVVGMSAVQRIFQAHELNWANFCITLVVCAVAPALQWLLVHVLGLGYLGCAWAQSLYNGLYFFLQVPYLCWRGHGHVFVPVRPSVLLGRAGVVEFMKLAAPGFWMVVLNWWVMEAVVLVAGLLEQPATTIGAFTITANLQACGEMAWIGLAVAASTLVGRAIGAGDVRVARRFAALTAAVGAALSIGLGLVLGLARSPIAALFTTDAAVNALTAALLPLLGGILLVDGSTNALGGACSGLGLQRASAAGQLLGYWVIGMPAGVAVAFGAMRGSRDGVFALWGGVGLSMLTASVVQLAVLLRLDWRKAAGEAEVRLRRGAADLDRALLAGEPTVNAVGVVPV